MNYHALFLVLTSVATWEMGGITLAQGANEPTPGHTGLLAQAAESGDAPDATSSTQPSDAVRQLQRRLAELGYYQGAIDGLYGPNTRQALIAFQQDAGLAGTGIVDPLTQERLNQAVLPSEAPGAASAGAEEGSEPESLPEAEGAADPSAETAEAAPEADLDLDIDSSEGASAAADQAAAPAEAADQQGWLRLMGIGLGLVLLAGLGGSVLLWLARKRSVEVTGSDDSGDATAAPETRDRAVASPEMPGATPPLATGAAAPPPNGNQTFPPGASATALGASSSQLVSAAPASTRLAKINIVDELIQDLENPDPGVRRKAIWELGQRGNSAAVQPLVRIMVEADSQEQSLILAALAEIGSQTLKPMNRALALSLQDENPEVRKNAIRDLTRIYNLLGQVGKILAHAVTDNDPDVRQTAHWALDHLNHLRLTTTESAALLQADSGPTEQLSGEGPPSPSPRNG